MAREGGVALEAFGAWRPVPDKADAGVFPADQAGGTQLGSGIASGTFARQGAAHAFRAAHRTERTQAIGLARVARRVPHGARVRRIAKEPGRTSIRRAAPALRDIGPGLST